MDSGTKPGLVRRVLRALWRALNWLRIGVMNAVFLLLLVMLVLTIWLAEPPAMPETAVLVVDPEGAIVEQSSFVDPLLRVMQPSMVPSETSLQDLRDVLEQAAGDDRIKALLLRLDELQAVSMSDVQEVAASLAKFRESGKPVIAVADDYGQQQYLLASHADQVYVHPMGGVDIHGFGAYSNYVAEALEKLKVDLHVFRVGEFKSALEPLVRNDMSPEAREDTARWLNALWAAYAATVETNRSLLPGAVDSYVDNIDSIYRRVGGSPALAALEYGLVDGVKNREEINAMLQALGGDDGEGGFNQVDFREYLNFHGLLFELPAAPDEDAIGVVVVEGPIVDGREPPGVAAGESIADLLRRARQEDHVKGVLLRVDTGGGSAFASEVIREQVTALQAAGKPVVVSMSGVAASGGYWVAAGADEIWATPTTITGSIGVVAALPTINRSLEALGVHTDGVATTALDGGVRLDRELNPKLRDTIQQSLEYSYQRFIELVAAGRGMTPEAVDQIARGKVWTGERAKELGLVDHLGGMQEALAAAGKLAGLGEAPATYWLRDDSWLEAGLLDRLAQSARAMQAVQSPLQQWLARAQDSILPGGLNDPGHLYLVCAPCQVMGRGD